ncbi:hypothetical protein Tco_1504646 [Tanacetum coccineum]
MREPLLANHLDESPIMSKALSVAIEEAIQGGTFNGVRVGNDPLIVSHFQFSDDVIFLGEWSYINLKNLLRILRCFHIASRLEVNLSKLALYGLGVARNEVDWIASTLKCTLRSLPFEYLGLPVGANMSISCHWSPIIKKFQKRFSSWKARCLSISGACFFGAGQSKIGKSHGSLGSKSWLIGSMGGLGIGSLSASNLSLLGKWWWRFHTEPDALLQQVISSIHGSCDGLNSNRDSIKGSGIWINILKAGRKINDIGVPFINYFKRKVISCTSTRIWKDVWFRSQSLDRFIQDGVDGWTWALDTSGSFKVSILRSCIDSLDLSRSDPANLRNELIPKKVNVFFWRLIRNCLPTKTNLVDKARSHDLLELSGSIVLASVFTKTLDVIIRITSWVI